MVVMFGFVLMVAWVLFAVVVLHQAWPALCLAFARWLQNGEYQFALIEDLRGRHRHRVTETSLSLNDVLERLAA